MTAERYDLDEHKVKRCVKIAKLLALELYNPDRWENTGSDDRMKLLLIASNLIG